MSKPSKFPLASYSSNPRRLLTARDALAAGVAALAILVIFTVGIEAHNAHRDRSTSFAYTDLPNVYQQAPTQTPTPAPTPTLRPDCLIATELVALIDRPVLPQAAGSLRPATEQETDGSGCLNLYSRPVELTEAADCIVMHEATPAQLCNVEDGYQYYFIGPDQTGAGPYLATVDSLSELHPTGTEPIGLYRGQSPLTLKSVVIQYLPDRRLLRISTYYADTDTSTDKPYIFTVDEDHEVSHLSW